MIDRTLEKSENNEQKGIISRIIQIYPVWLEGAPLYHLYITQLKDI